MNLTGNPPPRVEALTHVRVTQSLQGIALPIIVGTARVPGLLVYLADWAAHQAQSTSKSKGGKNAQYFYTASWIAALASGPIAGINAIWTQGGQYWPQPADPVTFPILATPAAPSLSDTAGGAILATTYYVRTTYTSSLATSGYDEGGQSAEASLAVPANYLLVVASPPSSSGAGGWNVYVGTSSGGEALQNTSPIAIGTNWTLPTSGLAGGAPPPPPPHPRHPVPVGSGPVGTDLGVAGPSGPFKRLLVS